MRASLRLSFGLTLMLASASLAVGTSTAGPSNPTTPADNLPIASLLAMCTLDSLYVTGGAGFTLTPTFTPNLFHYLCTTEELVVHNLGPYIVHPKMDDPGSTAEISLNGVPINFRTMGLPDGLGISNTGQGAGANGYAPYSPLVGASTALTFTYGWNNITIGVGCNGRSDPNCYYQYHIDCFKTPSIAAAIIGDPQFVGLRGQNYQIHGVSGEIYNIVSDTDLQYNSRFVFLDRGDCPVLNGKKQRGCFSHPGSYLGELGLKTRAGDRIHVLTGPAKDGFSGVEVNGKALMVGDTFFLAGELGSVSFNSTHVASVQIGKWAFEFENSDMYLNQRVLVADARGLRSHGLLGQTWRETVYPNTIKYIQGAVDDYVIRDADIFGDSFVYNTFN